MKFTISETDETLVSHSGLALAGALLQRTSIQKRADTIRLGDRKRPDVSHGDVVTAMIGLLCLGKPDFEAIEAFRDDEFFRQALGLEKVPSEGTLRQRLDELGYRCHTTLHEESADMIARHIPKLAPCYGDWIALDLDVSPFDNSGTKKEGVSWTYKKVDGYAPIFAYLAEYLIHCQLRQGSQHCQEGTPEFLDEAIAYARRVTQAKLLVRMDSGNDDVENMRRCKKNKVDWIIKRNLRQESLEECVAAVRADGPEAERPVAPGEADADPQARSPSSAAECDPGPDVPGGPLYPSRSWYRSVVLAEQPLAWSLGKRVWSVPRPGVPGHTLAGKESDAQLRMQWIETGEMLCPCGVWDTAVAPFQTVDGSIVSRSYQNHDARFA
jgi:hypothetical protein